MGSFVVELAGKNSETLFELDESQMGKKRQHEPLIMSITLLMETHLSNLNGKRHKKYDLYVYIIVRVVVVRDYHLLQ